MKTKTVCIALATLLTTSSCASSAQDWGNKRIKESKNYVTKEIKVGDFNKIVLNGSAGITYTQKPGKPQVVVHTSDNIAEALDIHEKGGTLYVSFKKGYSVTYTKLEINASSAGLQETVMNGSGDISLGNLDADGSLHIQLNGSGDIEGKDIRCTHASVVLAGSGDIALGSMECRELTTTVAGSGDVVLNGVRTSSVQASVAGSGDLTLRGEAGEAQYSVAGSGDLHASGLRAKSVNASVAGSGDITCYAADYLKARTTGSGSIGYKGEPKELDLPKKNIYEL